MPSTELAVDIGLDLARWAMSGGMALTGRAEGPPLAPPAPVASVLAALSDDAPALVGERGLTRNGQISCGGATRLLPCADGWLAVTLSRPVDIASVPAWVGVDGSWDLLAARLAALPAAVALEGARLLELPVAALGETPPVASPWLITAGASAAPRGSPPLVIDLSTLWAGPLCGDLLQRAGSTVVKVEDPRRPDGARLGPPAFFDLINGAKASVALDVRDASLHRLLDAADVVITSARPRALEQLGIDVTDVLARGPTVWVAITAHGWEGPGRDRVGFGDDAAVAAGLVTTTHGDPGFVADAVADPLCGALAAHAAGACLAEGGSWFVDASLAGAAAYAVGLATRSGTIAASPSADGWVVDGTPVAAPRTRSPLAAARPMGADNARFLAR